MVYWAPLPNDRLVGRTDELSGLAGNGFTEIRAPSSNSWFVYEEWLNSVDGNKGLAGISMTAGSRGLSR